MRLKIIENRQVIIDEGGSACYKFLQNKIIEEANKEIDMYKKQRFSLIAGDKQDNINRYKLENKKLLADIISYFAEVKSLLK